MLFRTALYTILFQLLYKSVHKTNSIIFCIKQGAIIKEALHSRSLGIKKEKFVIVAHHVNCCFFLAFSIINGQAQDQEVFLRLSNALGICQEREFSSALKLSIPIIEQKLKIQLDEENIAVHNYEAMLMDQSLVGMLLGFENHLFVKTAFGDDLSKVMHIFESNECPEPEIMANAERKVDELSLNYLGQHLGLFQNYVNAVQMYYHLIHYADFVIAHNEFLDFMEYRGGNFFEYLSEVGFLLLNMRKLIFYDNGHSVFAPISNFVLRDRNHEYIAFVHKIYLMKELQNLFVKAQHIAVREARKRKEIHRLIGELNLIWEPFFYTSERNYQVLLNIPVSAFDVVFFSQDTPDHLADAKITFLHIFENMEELVRFKNFTKHHNF